jgi:hypothetical protein
MEVVMPAKRTRVDRVCENCGTGFWIVPADIKKGGGKFCSWNCRVIFKRREALNFLREPLAQRQPNGCLIYAKSTDRRGYARVLGGKSGRKPAHVLSWEMANEREIPEGLFVCHNCPGGDNPSCIEPAHLWVGTHTENMADMMEKGRSAHGARNANAKLTDEDIREIRAAFQNGKYWTQAALARQYGVTRNLIGYIVHGSIWKHVGD